MPRNNLIVLLLAAAGLFSSCGNGNHYSLTGNLPARYDGCLVKLTPATFYFSEEKNSPEDSVKIKNGKFQFNGAVQKPTEPESKELHIIANNQEITLSGKEEYVFVDIFDYIDFDLSASHGRAIVTLINGVDAQYTQVLQDGDKIEVYWKENY